MRTRSIGVAVILLLAAGNAPAAAACVGDCAGDGAITVDELIVGVNIALGSTEVDQCSAMDANGDGQVTVDELVGAVSRALSGCTAGDFAGDYSGMLDLGGRMGGIELTVDGNGQATGSLVVDGAALRVPFGATVTFPVGGVSVSLSGNVQGGSGSFQLSGSFVDGNGQTVTVNISGNLPGPTRTVAITAHIGSETFTGTLSAAVAVPTPTPGPTPTPPTGGCADGIFAVTFANASGTNADTSTLTLGKVTATDLLDTTSNTYIWVISGNVCTGVFGEVARGLVLQGIGQTGRIQPGTYAIASPVPPFLSLLYNEIKFTFDPTQNFTHAWGATGGTLVLEDAGGGALRFRASGVTMTTSLVFRGATGTFTLDINGVITSVMHN